MINIKSSRTIGMVRERPNFAPGAIRLPLLLGVVAAVLLLGYFAVRSPKSPASPGAPEERRQTVIVTKRLVLHPVAARARPQEPATSLTTAEPAAEPKPVPNAVGSASVARELIARIAQPDYFSGGVT